MVSILSSKRTYHKKQTEIFNRFKTFEGVVFSIFNMKKDNCGIHIKAANFLNNEESVSFFKSNNSPYSIRVINSPLERCYQLIHPDSGGVNGKIIYSVSEREKRFSESVHSLDLNGNSVNVFSVISGYLKV